MLTYIFIFWLKMLAFNTFLSKFVKNFLEFFQKIDSKAIWYNF
jgi:hypothetical protein